mgnify:CR=1 FL=1
MKIKGSRSRSGVLSVTIFTSGELLGANSQKSSHNIIKTGGCPMDCHYCPFEKDENGIYHVPLDWTGEYLPYFFIDVTASPTDAKSWREAMQHLEQNSGLAMIGTWDKVEQQLRECSELLQINEKIIGNMRQGVNQFLNLLRGQTASGQTYGATGKAEVFADNPTITSA